MEDIKQQRRRESFISDINNLIRKYGSILDAQEILGGLTWVTFDFMSQTREYILKYRPDKQHHHPKDGDG